MITLQNIRENKDIIELVHASNMYLAALGYTDHGPRHISYVSSTAGSILKQLGYSSQETEIAKIAGWVHDVGNAVNRMNHGAIGATLLFTILKEINMPVADIVEVITAVGNHEEKNGVVTNPVSAALVIGDKSDAHRSRVRNGKPNPDDIHDRVNFAISHNKVEVLKEEKIIRQSIKMNDQSSVFEYCQIYMDRIIMCQEAAKFLNCTFQLIVNDTPVNNHISVDE